MAGTLRDIALDDFWTAVRGRLTVSSVTTPLGIASDAARASRVYLPDDDAAVLTEGPQGRVIIVPVTTAFDVETTDMRELEVRFRVLVQFAPYRDRGFDIRVVTSRVNVAVAARLEAWAPVLRAALVTRAVRLTAPAPAHPLRDVVEGLWFSSQEFGCLVAPKPVPSVVP